MALNTNNNIHVYQIETISLCEEEIQNTIHVYQIETISLCEEEIQNTIHVVEKYKNFRLAFLFE